LRLAAQSVNRGADRRINGVLSSDRHGPPGRTSRRRNFISCRSSIGACVSLEEVKSKELMFIGVEIRVEEIKLMER
jgi:hypothetical protein